MVMSDSEVKANVLQAKNPRAQIKICAELNATTQENIKKILRKQGIDLRSFNGKLPKNPIPKEIDIMDNSKENKQKGRPKKNNDKEPYRNTVFCNKLNKLFGDSGESQKVAANKFNTTRQTFGNWLAGRNQPDYETLIAIAKYYNVSIDYLLGLAKEPIPTKETTENVPETPIQAIRNRIDSLLRQRAGIDSELADLKAALAELTKSISAGNVPEEGQDAKLSKKTGQDST